MARILIVDDQKSALLTLDSILTKHGHVVVSVTNTHDALACLIKNPIDLIITDAVMPGITGFDLIKAIRKENNFQKIGIIMVTGRREKKDVEQSLKAGADDFVVKPVDPDILMAKVAGLLSKRGASSNQDFYECKTFMPAKWLANTSIVAISEVGVTLTSQIQLPIGFKTKVESELFETMEIDPPTLRITNCFAMATDTQMYTLHSHFVGLTEKELQAIRLWLVKKEKVA